MPTHLLVVASETPDQQETRRRDSGQASHETYIETLLRLDGATRIDDFNCVVGDERMTVEMLEKYDGIIFAGSPIQMYNETDETRSAAAFMAKVYRSGTPSFGSCAGLQIAAVGAGGTVKPRGGMKAGVTRRIVPTKAGRSHPLLAGRPPTWDAPAMHATIVDTLPAGATVLAKGEGTPVEAATINHDNGTFWGVQYHPEIALEEIADALERSSDDLIEQGFARSHSDVTRHADAMRALDEDAGRKDLAWQLGLDRQVTDFTCRTREIANFLHAIGEKV